MTVYVPSIRQPTGSVLARSGRDLLGKRHPVIASADCKRRATPSQDESPSRDTVNMTSTIALACVQQPEFLLDFRYVR